MPLPWQHTFYHCQKRCLAHLHPKANICAKFHENWWKTEEVVRDARFFPHFCHNMPLPWQLFLSLSKNVSCTSTLQGKHLCQISWELVKNWGSSSRRKIGDRPPDRPTRLATDRPTRRHADSYIPPLYTTCMRGYNYSYQLRVDDFKTTFEWQPFWEKLLPYFPSCHTTQTHSWNRHHNKAEISYIQIKLT